MSTKTEKMEIKPGVPSVLVKHQKRVYGPRVCTEDGIQYPITATVRYDDQCGNGHNSFSITADIKEKRSGMWWDYSGGCCRDKVAEHFPELAPFLKWHLVDAEQPMHYVANAVYFAGDRDHNGLRKGEKRQILNGRTGLPVWQIVVRDEKGEKVEVGHLEWVNSAACPEKKMTAAYEPVWQIGEGKERQLDAARKAAVWPEATDEQLCAEPGELKRMLLERLPALQAEFRRDVESLGFVY